MNVSAQAMQNAFEIQKVFEDRYAQTEEVVGVGIGLNHSQDDLAINVQVSDQSAVEALPKTFKGLDVVVDVVGVISAY